MLTRGNLGSHTGLSTPLVAALAPVAIFALIAQSGRAPVFKTEGRGFKSHWARIGESNGMGMRPL